MSGAYRYSGRIKPAPCAIAQMKLSHAEALKCEFGATERSAPGAAGARFCEGMKAGLGRVREEALKMAVKRYKKRDWKA